jgi:hypothetical protein
MRRSAEYAIVVIAAVYAFNMLSHNYMLLQCVVVGGATWQCEGVLNGRGR